jgi:3'-5' exoribonuclease
MSSQTAVIPVKSLADKDPVVDRVFIVKDKHIGTGKNGKMFLTALLADKTGQLDARLWDNVDAISGLFEIGDLVKVKGLVQIYNQKKQFVIHRLENAVDMNLNKEDYILETEKIDTSVLLIKLLDFVDKIQAPPIKQLCLDCLNDEEIKAKLLIAPAAKTVHHAKRGGLLQHIVSICQIMDFMGTHYSFLNKDLLMFGALFHDLGKVWELDISHHDQISYTEKGQLLGHMNLACELVDKKTAKILGFPEDLKTILKHIILSHHGKIEYGSPKLPMFPEALVIAMVDEFDSKVDQVFNFVNQERQSGEKWSRYSEFLERYFYLEELKGKWT